MFTRTAAHSFAVHYASNRSRWLSRTKSLCGCTNILIVPFIVASADFVSLPSLLNPNWKTCRQRKRLTSVVTISLSSFILVQSVRLELLCGNGAGRLRFIRHVFCHRCVFTSTNIKSHFTISIRRQKHFIMIFFLTLLTSSLSLATMQDNSTGCASGYQMNCCPNYLISGFYAPCDDAIPITTGNWTECDAKAYPGGWVCCISNEVSR